MTRSGLNKQGVSEIQAIATELATLMATRGIDATTLPDPLARLRARAENQARLAKAHRLRAKLIAVFAARRGWQFTRHDYSVRSVAAGRTVSRPGMGEPMWIGPLVDHRGFFRVKRQGPVAMASHAYDADDATARENAVAWGEAHGLRVSFPDFPSWWFPGRTTLILFETTHQRCAGRHA